MLIDELITQLIRCQRLPHCARNDFYTIVVICTFL